MKLTTPDGTEMIQISSIERSGSDLLIKGQVMGALPMSVVLRPEDARDGLKLMNWKVVIFALTLLFRPRRRQV
jgi:hypothetical protein